MNRIHTKIVCTIGITNKRDSLESCVALLEAGMNVARINMSHSPSFREERSYIPGKTYKKDRKLIGNLRSASRKTRIPLAILADLMGPKIRIGEFVGGGCPVKKGASFILHNDMRRKGDETGIFIEHFNAIARRFKAGSCFLFSDGLIRMRAVKCDKSTGMEMEILDNGFLRSRQGVVIKGMEPDIPSMTVKDHEDLKFLMDSGVDFIAISYVKSANDIRKIKKLMENSDKANRPGIIAKIETAEAVKNIHEIIDESDGIMVARGDLGMRVDVEHVPILQKEIINLCNIVGKPVITATQMLESMIERPFPTRAEATDVANAIFDGTDAIMLSGETAIGAYPIECVCTMREIASCAEEARRARFNTEFQKREWRKRIEKGIEDLKSQKRYPSNEERIISDAITIAAAEIAEDLNLKMIMTLTTSGQTARLMARFRSGIPIIAPVENELVGRKLLLSHAVFPVKINSKNTPDLLFKEAVAKTLSAGYLKEKELYLATSGYPLHAIGSTNLLKIMKA